jgi:hypothetical protein
VGKRDPGISKVAIFRLLGAGDVDPSKQPVAVEVVNRR